MPRHKPGDRVDHYEVVELLGVGAYAEVYRAVDVRTGTDVVLKNANPQLFADPAVFQRYRREADIARTLDHPGVQRSLDPSEHRTEPYLVLEYVEGKNLRQVLRERKRIPVPEAVDWVTQLAQTLAYLHVHGVVHRDLKPENILVSADNRLKVSDFGAALRDGARRLTFRHLTDGVGTPEYMSPEQVQGRRGDPRSDIYAWGVITYELLTRRPPFEGKDPLEAMGRHLTDTPRSIRSQRREVSPALEAIVLRALRRYPEHRYQRVEDLLADLEHVDTLSLDRFDLSPEPPMAGVAAAQSAWEIWRFALIVAGGFIVVVAVVIAIAALLG
ncbi:MAG: serine/threonine protein kinase [Acidimicrobiia bacterium]|nr:serine/threonine protein kinase [Acidimicrobiia bacterium]